MYSLERVDSLGLSESARQRGPHRRKKSIVAHQALQALPCALEHREPQSSRLWSWPLLQQYLARTICFRVLIHYCQYGCRYQKPTLLLTDLEELTCLSATCKGGHMHEHLQGTVRLQSGPDAGR
eukprot:12450943-Heterocapsa_arctica.AAC.1